MNTKPKFHAGQRLVFWTKEGEGVYDGLTCYVRGVREVDGVVSYLVSEYVHSEGAGWVEETDLLSITEWQQKLITGDAASEWSGKYRLLKKGNI